MTKRNAQVKNNTRKSNRNNAQTSATQKNAPIIEARVLTLTQKAHEAAKRQEATDKKREAAKAAREREKALAGKFDATCMSVNDALRAVAAHAKDTLEEGFTVADYMQTKGLKKLTVKGLRDALPSDFVREDGIYMPTIKRATVGTCEEDPNFGKPLFYFVEKGKGTKKRRSYKSANLYGFSRIDLWTPAVVRRLLSAGMAYSERKEYFAKRNAEMKAVKKFYVINEVNEKATNGKVKCEGVRTTTYTEIAAVNVKWAE